MLHYPYPAYKPSGIPWLSDVPEHWSVEAVKQSYEIQLGKMLQPNQQDLNDTEVPYLKAVNVQWFKVRTSDPLTMWASPMDTRQYGVEQGDLLVCEGGEGGRCGIVRSSVSGYIIQNALHRVRAREHSLNEYLQFVLYVAAAHGYFEALNDKATIAHFTKEKLAAFRIPLPPLPEQRAIVRYLDHVDRRIRPYVAAKRKLIALLEEEKQAVVNQAVTRGLDPNVRLKPSGVEWLGDVPEHWEVGSLKRFAARRLGSIKAGPFGSQLTAAEMTEGDFKVYTQRNVIDRDLEKGSNYISSAKFDFLRAFEVVSGDVLVTSRGTIGRTALVSDVCEPGVLHPCLLRVQPDLGCLIPEFLMTLIQDSQLLPQQLTFLSNTTTIDVIYSSTLSNTVIPLPSLPEQAAILEHVDRATADIDSASARARGQIELVNEYRTRLIADVVTGKLDVRDAAAQLPEEGEGELLDDNGVILDYTGGGAFDEHMPTEGETAIESEVTA